MNRTNAYHYQENVRSNIETIQHLHMQVSVFACLVDQRLRLLVNIAMSDIHFLEKIAENLKSVTGRRECVKLGDSIYFL